MCISRRAMACSFLLIFPAGCRRPIDAGCAALDEVERLESKLSAYRADSDLSYVNRHACEAPVAADAELFELCELASRLTQATGGAFDIATGALIKAWGFYRGPQRVPGEAERREALAASGMGQVELDAGKRTIRYRRPGVEINFGSIGKGYAIDRALDRIRERFRASCVLMQGGQSSVKGLGTPPGEPRGWKVAIGDPYRRGRAVATVRLRNRALGTSGSAHQYFVHEGRRYGHVIDPRTGWPADQLASASALAPSAAQADALSTAFFVGGVEFARRHCREHPGIGAVLVSRPQAGRTAEVIVIGVDDAEITV